MVNANPFGKLQKMWAVTSGDAIFLLFSVCSVDLDIPCSRLSSSTTTKFTVLCLCTRFPHRCRFVWMDRKHAHNNHNIPRFTGKGPFALLTKMIYFLFTKLFKLVASSSYKKVADLYEQSSQCLLSAISAFWNPCTHCKCHILSTELRCSSIQNKDDVSVITKQGLERGGGRIPQSLFHKNPTSQPFVIAFPHIIFFPSHTSLPKCFWQNSLPR